MKAFIRFFNNLPFVPRILLLVFLGILLFAAFKRMGSAFQGMDWLLTVVGVLWLIVILGVLHAAGWLGPVSRWPVIGPGLNWLTNRPVVVGPPPPPPIPHTLEKCRQVAAEQMATLQGIDTVFNELNRWRNGFRANRPGVIFWLTGPRGTGKSTLASALGCYFCGHGAIRNDKVRRFTWNDLQQRGLDKLNDLAQESLDGILLLDGADWLAEENPAGQAGAALHNIAETHRDRLTVVVTCKTETPRRLNNDAQHRERWLDHFTQHSIEFPTLSDDALLSLIRSMAAAVQLDIEENEEATGTLRRWLREMRRKEGENFANALTAQGVVDHIIKQRPNNQPLPIRFNAERLRTIASAALGLPL